MSDPKTIRMLSSSLNERDIRRSVQELCGLAGVTPVSRDSKCWNGSVIFEEHNTCAKVSYAHTTEMGVSDTSKIISRIRKALTDLSTAISRVQAAGLCCNSFTILAKLFDHSTSQNLQSKPIEMWQIKLGLAVALLENIRGLSAPNGDKLDYHQWEEAGVIASHILEPLHRPNKPQQKTIEYTLHMCSLSAQFLCLGFLSYIQAHIGFIQPFFLDSPLSKIFLLGTQSSMDDDHITAELQELTCVGDMTQGPVLTFHLNTQQSPSIDQHESKYDLLACGEDILDT
jgi:hypothetical protein